MVSAYMILAVGKYQRIVPPTPKEQAMRGEWSQILMTQRSFLRRGEMLKT
jgi:hypothetical protein